MWSPSSLPTRGTSTASPSTPVALRSTLPSGLQAFGTATRSCPMHSPSMPSPLPFTTLVPKVRCSRLLLSPVALAPFSGLLIFASRSATRSCTMRSPSMPSPPPFTTPAPKVRCSRLLLLPLALCSCFLHLGREIGVIQHTHIHCCPPKVPCSRLLLSPLNFCIWAGDKVLYNALTFNAVPFADTTLSNYGINKQRDTNSVAFI